MKEINTTYLSLDRAEERGFLHRDYIAHCFRWSHIIKFLQKNKTYENANILDLGCGKEVPLLKTMYTMKMSPKSYIGLDYTNINISNVLTSATKKCEVCKLESNYDISEDVNNYINENYSIIISFEVIEHMSPQKLLKLLNKMSKKLNNKADIFISTPNFDGKAATNHINEMTQEFLSDLFVSFGFEIYEKFGTFASQSDYLEILKNDGYENLFNKLNKYYDSNIISIIFAPLYPEKSRNVIWHLKHYQNDFDINLVKEVIKKHANNQQNKEEWRKIYE